MCILDIFALSIRSILSIKFIMSKQPTTTNYNQKRKMNKNRKWNARWIWSDVSENEKNVFYYFRKTFDLKSTSKNYKLFISADTRYQLFINGKLIGRGVPQSQPFYQYYDEYNLDDKLIKGENCIAVVVYHLGTLPDTRGGLLLEITGPEDETVVKTDATWRVKKSPAWQQNTYSYLPNRVTPFQEFFDARLEPLNWKEISFDNYCWLHSTIVAGMIHNQLPCAGPWAKLVPSVSLL